MLVLARDEGEGIVLTLGDLRVRIVIVEVRKSKQVRVGIDAPPDVIVNRDEIQRQVDKERGNG